MILEEFASLGGFDTLIDTIILDENLERTPIRLKLKALNAITYIWQENKINGLHEIRSKELAKKLEAGLEINRIERSTDLEKLCNFFLLDGRLYHERKYPFEEKDSLQWIEQVIEVINSFSVPCFSVWEKDKRNSSMLQWILSANSYIRAQVEDVEEDEDIKAMLMNLQSTIDDVLSMEEVFIKYREKDHQYTDRKIEL